MLILSRNIGETITIGDDIRLTVFGVNRDQVRLGVHAPKHIAIHREEIYRVVKAERQQSQTDNSKLHRIPTDAKE